MNNLFKDKKGNTFGGISYENFQNIIKEFQEKYFISTEQIIEASSFSMAMVIRSHLGLSAEGGVIGAVVKDNLAGQIALATARRLYNAGTTSNIIIPQKDLGNISKEFEHQAEAVCALGLELTTILPEENENNLNDLFSHCDNVLMGVFDNSANDDISLRTLSNILNELSTPIHSILSPYGISPDTGEKVSVPIYSSSTLSLGIPLLGLFNGNDFVGRHYVCEISIPKEISLSVANIPETLFSEQPVCQIFKI